MPKRKADGQAPNWGALYEQAAPQAGYFTHAQGLEAGYSPVLLQYYVREGRLERAGRGIFRLAHYPPSDHEDLVSLWLWSGQHGVFSHDTALALHGLSDVMPASRHLTVPNSWRRRRVRVAAATALHYSDVAETDFAWQGPIPVTAISRTILDCIADQIEPDLVRQAIPQAEMRGLITRSEAASLAESLAASIALRDQADLCQ